MITKTRISLLLLLGWILPVVLHAQVKEEIKEAGSIRPAKVAVVVVNRAGPAFTDRVQAFEDRIIAAITSDKLQLVSREDVIKSLKPNEVDEAFEKHGSAVRLANSLGAEYLLLVSIVSMDREEKEFEGYGVSTKNDIFTLEATYRLVSVLQGGALFAGATTVSETIRQTENSAQSTGNVANKLLSRAAIELGEKVRKDTGTSGLPVAAKQAGEVSVIIQAVMEDFKVPDVVKGEDGKYRVTENAYQLDVSGATIEVNGLLVGSTSATVPQKVPAGINRLRISRPGYEPIERNVNFVEGQTLIIPMRMDAQGMARMKEIVAGLQQIKRNAALTDAEVEVLQGQATYLKQSGIRLDHRTDVKSDVKVDADKLPDIQQTRNSIFP
jgi:hypothetical protein